MSDGEGAEGAGRRERGESPRSRLSALARWLGYASAACLVAMMMITVADVVLRAAFNRPITGTYDLVQFFLVGIVFLNLPAVFLAEENIAVDLVDHFAHARAVALLKVAGAGFGLAFLALLCWQVIGPAMDSVAFGETASDLPISLGWYWALIILGLFATLPAAGAVLVGYLRATNRRTLR